MLVACLALLGMPSVAQADALEDVTQIRVRDDFPFSPVVASDGSLWYVALGLGSGAPGFLGKVTPDGEVSRFKLLNGMWEPSALAIGADQNVWVLTEGFVGRVTPDGTITKFRTPKEFSYPGGFVATPDGRIGFADERHAGFVNAAGEFTVYPGAPRLGYIWDVAAAPDGSLWYSGGRYGRDQPSWITRVTPAGEVTAFELPMKVVHRIVFDAAGNVWFIDKPNNDIVRMTQDGERTTFRIPTKDSGPADLIYGPDGRIWFPERNANRIAAMTVDGEFTEYELESKFPGPNQLITGPDGAVWYGRTHPCGVGRVEMDGTTDASARKGGFGCDLWLVPGVEDVWTTDAGSVVRFGATP